MTASDGAGPRGNLGVVFNEQSGQVVVGRLNKAEDDLLDEIQGVTDTAVVAVADFVFQRGGALTVGLGGDNAYQIEVVRVGRSGGHRIAILPGSEIVGLPDE